MGLPITPVSPRSSSFPGQTASQVRGAPNEIWLHIFSFLPMKGVLSMGVVCREWKQISDDNGLWKRFFLKDFPNHSLQEEQPVVQQYRSTYTVERNWRQGKFQQSQIKPELSWLKMEQLHNDWLICMGNISGEGKVVQIWDKNNRSQLQAFKLPKDTDCEFNSCPSMDFGRVTVHRMALIVRAVRIEDCLERAFIWSLQTGKLDCPIPLNRSTQFALDENQFYFFYSNCLGRCDLSSRSFEKICEDNDEQAIAAALIIDGNQIIYGRGSTIVSRDKHTGALLSKFRGGSFLDGPFLDIDRITNIAPFGDYLIVGYTHGKWIQVWSKTRGCLIAALPQTEMIIPVDEEDPEDVAEPWSGDGKLSLKIEGIYLLVNRCFWEDSDYPVFSFSLWDTRDWSLIANEEGVVDAIVDGDRIIIAHHNGVVMVRNVSDYSPLVTINTNSEGASITKIAMDKVRLFVQFFDRNEVQIWNKQAGVLITKFKADAFFLDGNKLITLEHDCTPSSKAKIIIRDYSPT